MFMLSPLGSSPHNLASFPLLPLCWQVTSSCFEAVAPPPAVCRSAIKQELHSVGKVTQWGSWIRDDYTPFFRAPIIPVYQCLFEEGGVAVRSSTVSGPSWNRCHGCTLNSSKFGRVSVNMGPWHWLEQTPVCWCRYYLCRDNSALCDVTKSWCSDK